MPVTHLNLPVGPVAKWEVNTNATRLSELKTVAESCLVLQSLRQSRDRWLSSTFPKFSTKPRGSRAPGVVPPPHSITFQGRCDLEIGPHIFRDTAFFEVRYLSQFTPQQYVPASNPSQGTPGASSSAQRASTPLISSLTSEVTVTPALVSQVNRAAATNPTLAHLVYLAATGQATQEQVKTLGLLIQSMATTRNNADSAASTSSHQGADAMLLLPGPQGLHPTSSQDFDLVMEFKELPNERLLFPRVPVVCTSLAASSDAPLGTRNIGITTCLPFPTAGNQGPPQLVNLCLRRASSVISDLLSRWAGDEEKMANNQRILDQTPSSAFMKESISRTGFPKTDVPLLMGGRFCRQCIDAGRASSEVSGIQDDLKLTHSGEGNTSQNAQAPGPRKPKPGRRTSTAFSFTSSPLAVNPPTVPDHSVPEQ
ncbi:hypothetical protein GLOTRDRAFT_118675 [Gloeophyllum trabeum ATCC 11539]|uniref:Uncharacterized protein n=1 Tax=Gloeophyllum trabeum (strain ATCC 11539 / FP-39264 / Madison 617) TaxID=670483 RepID=S7QLS0_GLOTA|nr:uncharacterized protein GLOTRDRAFT_118675 [Gloeophyllum trabeum ATCC 11539]EPQ60382.1 hypothetical protein GLOTRDRAFT_118675 [Gloeophyllum trabeum ATCC 11539]